MALPHLSTRLDGTKNGFEGSPPNSLSSSIPSDILVRLDSKITLLDSKKSHIGRVVSSNLFQYLSDSASSLVTMLSSYPSIGPGPQSSTLLYWAFWKQRGFRLACSSQWINPNAEHSIRGMKLKNMYRTFSIWATDSMYNCVKISYHVLGTIFTCRCTRKRWAECT